MKTLRCLFSILLTANLFTGPLVRTAVPAISGSSFALQAVVQPSWTSRPIERLQDATTLAREEHFYPFTTRHMGFAGRKLIIPDYLRPLVVHRWWKEVGGMRIYGKPGPTSPKGGRWAYPSMELAVRHSLRPPHVYLRLHLEDETHVKTEFQNLQTGESTEKIETWTAERGMIFLLELFSAAWHFMDAAVGIPLQTGPARAQAVRDWVLGLEATGKALLRPANSMGIGGKTLRIPSGVKQNRLLIRGLSEAGPRNSRYLVLNDNLQPANYLAIARTPPNEQADEQVIDVATGEPIPARGSPARWVYMGDFEGGQNFFQNASRQLKIRLLDSGITRSYLLRDEFRTKHVGHKLVLDPHRNYKIIKVELTTSVTTTGGQGAGKNSPFTEGTDLEAETNYPGMIGDLSMDAEEVITESIRAVVLSDPNYIHFPIDVQFSFIGYARAGELYAYWKRLAGSIVVDGQVRAVYRRMSADDEHVLVQTQMISNNFFTVNGIAWADGPLRGQLVPMKLSINLPILVGKYVTGGPIAVDPKIQSAFMPDSDLLAEGLRAYRVPELRIEGLRLMLVPGRSRRVKDLKPLEEEAQKELRQLRDHALRTGT